MTYVIVSFAVFVLFMAAMALGVIFSNKPLKGSCGGLGKIMGANCDICGNRDKCVKRR